MPFPDFDHPWDTKPLGEVFKLCTTGVIPANYPEEEFLHYSIPAWDALGDAVIERGDQIDSGKLWLTEPCVIVSKLNPQILRVRDFYPPTDGRRACASTESMPYLPRSDKVRIDFYKHYMTFWKFRRNLIAAATGTTNSHRRVRPPATLLWIIPVPQPEEQAAIARILDAVDTAIERTQDAINRAQELRRSLLQSLLSVGLSRDRGHHEFAMYRRGCFRQAWRPSSIGA